MSRKNETSLLDTLLVALGQCQEQVKLLEQQSQKLEALTNEIHLLRNELDRKNASPEVSGTHNSNDVKSKAESSELEELRLVNAQLRHELDQTRIVIDQHKQCSQYNARLQELFKQDVVKSREIRELKEKLKTAKINAQRLSLHDELFSSSPISSPRPSSAEGILTPVQISNGLSEPTKSSEVSSAQSHNTGSSEKPSRQPITTPKKRLRGDYARPDRALQELDPNSSRKTTAPNDLLDGKNYTSSPRAKKARHSDHGISAIASVTEDGENILKGYPNLAPVGARIVGKSPAFDRLSDLMSVPTPNKPVLLQPSSNDEHTKFRQEAEVLPAVSKSFEDATPNNSSKSRFKSPHVSINRPAIPVGPEDDEPLRSRPLNRLDLSHFKLNPATNSGLDYAYNEVVRGRQERRCLPGCTRSECCGGKFGSLGATLSRLPGMENASDHDILRAYMGPNSDDTIRKMTPLARKNLLHEARTKLVADAYGKMHRGVHERHQSPPGFWGIDMPDSQEARHIKDEAKSRQREEVRRRYEEALKESGKWIFADE